MAKKYAEINSCIQFILDQGGRKTEEQLRKMIMGMIRQVTKLGRGQWKQKG